jgi:hypothetical protein
LRLFIYFSSIFPGCGAGRSFGETADLYITAHEAGWRSPVHARQWRSSLRDYAIPIIGPLPVAKIETGDVMRVLEPIWNTKAETASRVRQRLEAVLDYAKTREWRTAKTPPGGKDI